MRKSLVFFACVFSASLVFFYVTGRSQARVADCVAFTYCKTDPTAQGCDLTVKWTKCNGSRRAGYGGCTNQGCIS
jgi:hypothetical protein